MITAASLIAVMAFFLVAAGVQAGELMPLDASTVCMVNDSSMGKPQIPVEVDGKTYYGCCEGCVDKLKNNRTLRYSVDPVTGNEVDKASAVIIENPHGGTLYFESGETAARFVEKAEGIMRKQ